MQALTAERTASIPRLWPAIRGNKRDFAQRPLPSIIIATCWGIMPASGIILVELGLVKYMEQNYTLISPIKQTLTQPL